MPNNGWTSRPVKAGHIIDYARYRMKAGGDEGKEAARILLEAVRYRGGYVTYDELSQGVDTRTAVILTAAFSFIHEIYDELEAPGP
jgi:hypothetical protein